MRPAGRRAGPCRTVHSRGAFRAASAGPRRLEDAVDVFGSERQAVVARELTKMHETLYRDSLSELVATFQAMDRIRGEIVLLIAPAIKVALTLEDAIPLLQESLTRLKPGKAASEVSGKTGFSRQALYDMALDLKAKTDD